MSEFREQIRSLVTDEWTSTRDIAGKVPMGRNGTAYSHIRLVYKHLDRMHRNGEVEKCIMMKDSYRMAMWRNRI